MEKVNDDVTKEQLVDDFKKVVEDAEALLKATARHGGDELKEVRARAEESLRVAKARMAEESEVLMVKTRHAVRSTNAYIHENPWQAIGIAASVGLLIGLITRRR